MVRATMPRMRGFMFRENRVPYYQRQFQKNDGKRQWWKTDRSPYIMYPYYVILWGSAISSTWMMGRLVLGHKTAFGSD